MGTFDNYADSPANNIQNEGQEITLKLTKTSATTARVSWNIPTPMDGCSEANQSYNGIVVLLDTIPANVSKIPVDGTVYTGDPTADFNLHAGDRISTALVIGSFYDDKTTTFLDITGLTPNTPYYVSAHAVDNVLRYHKQGVHAYVLDYGNVTGTPTAGYQVVDITAAPGDPTGLAAATTYTFKVAIDGADDTTIALDGTNASTYADLVDELNKQFALLDSPPLSAGFPNANALYWDTANQLLYKWDGNNNVLQDAIVDNTDPSIPTIGDYWFNTSTGDLNLWDGLAWQTQTIVEYSQDPTDLECDDYWFTGTSAFVWNGTVWCPKNLYNQAVDPSLPPTMSCPTFWYDTANEYLYEWKEESSDWVTVDAIMWATDPTTVVNGDYWFDVTNSLVKQWNGASWIDTGAVIGDEPNLPANGTLWFDTDTQELFQWNAGTTTWDLLSVKIWEFEPNNPPACSVWWNTTSDELYNWDTQTNAWVLISNFVQSAIDPSLALVMTEEDVWYNSVEMQLYKWDGSQWVAVTFVTHTTDPTQPNVNDAWFNTQTETWSIWTGAAWTPITVQSLDSDPYVPTAGDFWFDTGTNTLYQHNGIGWVSVLYSTTPYTPTTGSQFFNTLTDTLMEWNGTQWVEAALRLMVSFDENGDLKFTSGTTGSGSSIILTDVDLFKSLQPQPVVLLDYVLGTDGVSGTPTYKEVGIGTDGSADERRELIDNMRSMLGHPQVQVELTKYQWDKCLDLALQEYRRRTSHAYKRAFMFLDLQQGINKYTLSNKTVGFNTIVTVMGIYRVSSSAFGPGYAHPAYEQMVLQYLYQSGKYDLVSYHLIHEYIETMNHIFANDISFHWDEGSRELTLHQTAWFERVLLDVVVEKTEQDLIKDRYARNWIEHWAIAEAKSILAQIRGKYATLPGAGGGVALNASELVAQVAEEKAALLMEIEDYIADDVENYGMGAAFTIG